MFNAFNVQHHIAKEQEISVQKVQNDRDEKLRVCHPEAGSLLTPVHKLRGCKESIAWSFSCAVVGTCSDGA